MSEFRIVFVVKLFLVFFISVTNSAPALDTIWHKHQNKILTGLYSSSDPVVRLNSTDLENTIYGAKNSWIVEFYANWCPHCQRFTAIWKTLSYSIENWKDIVNVGVFDCATVEGTPFCHKYRVETVPAIRYFSPFSQSDSLGHVVNISNINESEKVEVLREKIIDSLRADQAIGKELSWPNLEPLIWLKADNIFDGIPMSIKYYFIIFEAADSYLGMTTILDFHSVPTILISRVSSDNKELCDAFEVKGFPKLIAVNRGNLITNLTLPGLSRSIVFNQIKNFINSKGIEIDITNVIDDSIIRDKYSIKKKSNQTTVTLKDDNIYQADLDAALRYSLEQEISLSSNISGEKIVALKNYLEVLAEYFPKGLGHPDYLKNIYHAVENKTSIDGQEFHDLVASLEESSQPQKYEWIGCKGSLSYTRGYTCGLWTMFHTLTTKYAIAVDKNPTNNVIGEKVLLVIHGYVKNFFGCSHCAKHFVVMAQELNIDESRTADQAALWLWKAHNRVNLRLANADDEIQDPEYPKIEYPAKVHCPKCRYENGTWNEFEVLNYLKEKYGGSRIIV